MTDPSPAPGPPAWVSKRDGRLVPFEADKISRSLFAASESLGRPDAFLARELTDGVVHFLSTDAEESVPTTAQVAELTAKVVRELGQPALAHAYASYTRPRPALEQPAGQSAEIVVRCPANAPLAAIQSACLRAYTLQTVFTRDLVAAQNDGLLTLTGLETPFELAGCVLRDPPAGTATGAGLRLVEAIERARCLAGGFLVVDGPEYSLARIGPPGSAEAASYVREMGIGLRATGLRAVINLNSSTPPSWADDLAEGPLFAGQQESAGPGQVALLADLLRDEIGKVAREDPACPPWRIDWHLGERDFQAPGEPRLLQLAHLALSGAPLAFTFDRPRRPVALAEGVDRRHPAVLLVVGLHLPRFADQVGIGSGGRKDAGVFLQKLGSLARLALSAAVQKREFLRRHSADRPAITRGFLLDRARLVVAPVGLDSLVRSWTRQSMCAGGAGLEFARQVVQHLRAVLRDDGGRCQLDVSLDAPLAYELAPGSNSPDGDNSRWPSASAASDREPDLATVAGLTAWEAAPVKDQLRAAGILHAAAATGTAAVLLPADQSAAAEQVADWMRWAWRQTDLVRIRLARVGRETTLTPDEPQLFGDS